MSDRRIVGFSLARRSPFSKTDATLRTTPRLAYPWTDLPANVCQTSGGSPRWRRFASSTMALEPAPPGTAPLTMSTPGLDARNAANSASRAAASDPDVHHDTTSSFFVLFVALVGALPHAASASAKPATAAAAAARHRALMPRPRPAGPVRGGSPEGPRGPARLWTRSARPSGRTARRAPRPRSTRPG